MAIRVEGHAYCIWCTVRRRLRWCLAYRLRFDATIAAKRTRVRLPSSDAAIYISPMTDSNDLDDTLAVIDGIEDTVLPHAQAIVLHAA